jgi:hypothetical protein
MGVGAAWSSGSRTSQQWIAFGFSVPRLELSSRNFEVGYVLPPSPLSREYNDHLTPIDFIDSLLVHTQPTSTVPSCSGIEEVLDSVEGVDLPRIEFLPNDLAHPVSVRKRKNECVKDKGSPTRLVLGEDITMSHVF